MDSEVEEVLDEVFVVGVLDCIGETAVKSCLISRYSCFKSLSPTWINVNIIKIDDEHNSNQLLFSPCSIQPNKTFEAGDKPALKRVKVGSISLVRGGKQSTNLRSGVFNNDFVNSYNADTCKKY